MKASIKVFYFASLRELVGKSEDSFFLAEPVSASDLWASLNTDIVMPESSLVAINHENADLQTVIHDNDEVAFFPPVTGG